MTNWLSRITASLGLAAMLGLSPLATASDQSDLIANAEKALQDVGALPDMDWYHNNIKKARAVLIAPKIVKAGFILGGSGGRGVMLVKDPKTGQWAGPAFYSLATGSIGFQAGVAVSQVVMLIMTEKGMASFMSGNFKLGGDISVAAGPVGGGAKSNVVADVYTFSASKGLYGGLNLDGTAVNVSRDWNTAYYGQEASPMDILIQQTVSNPEGDSLKAALTQAAM